MLSHLCPRRRIPGHGKLLADLPALSDGRGVRGCCAARALPPPGGMLSRAPSGNSAVPKSGRTDGEG